MNEKQVTIYAYNDNRGVFFYNGKDDERDAVIDALKEDSKTTLTPKYEGFKLTKIDGIGELEAELFTADKGAGNGVYVVGQRFAERYIDIEAIGAGAAAPEYYYRYAKTFHKVGEWYNLNIQYKGTWVKVRGVLKNYKLETENVFRRQRLTASFLIPDPTDDTYWHDIFTLSKLPTYEIEEASPSDNLVSEVIDVATLRAAGYPKLIFKLKFNEFPTHADSYDNSVNIKVTFTYTKDGKKTTKNWNRAAYIYFDDNNALRITSQVYSGYTLDSNSYLTLGLKLNPADRKYSLICHAYKSATSGYEDITRIANSSYTTYAPAGIEIETIQFTVTKSDSMDAEITWEAQQ